MKNISLVFISDGRSELLEQTLNSFHNNISFPFFERLIINDSIDEDAIKSVNNLSQFYGLTPIHHEEKRGFAGAYDTAFKSVSKDADYVFFCEDDFTFNQPILIQEMMFILSYNRNLVQCCLKRQAWNEEEKKAGGIVEQKPELFEEKSVGELFWAEHRVFYSTNPNLTPFWVVERGWPLLPHSEGVFSMNLFQNPNYKSCFFGKKLQAPTVTHIGVERKGVNY